MIETPGRDRAPLLLKMLAEMGNSPNMSPRDKHRITLLQSICFEPGLTRKDLIAQTKIRPGTVSELTGELLADGLVEEAAPSGQRERGRPEVPLHPVWARWVAVSVYCSSMELRADLIDAADEVLFRAARRLPSSADNSDVESMLIELVNEVVGHVGAKSELLGIALSIAGLVDTQKNDWIFSARWPRIRHLALGHLQEVVGVPVYLMRQLDLQLEFAMLSNPELRKGNTLLFHWGYGIGGAFAANGEVVQSRTGVFCQIGHVSVFPKSTRPCICGRIGCLEADAALWALTPEIERTHGTIPHNEEDLIGFLATHPIVGQPYFQHAQMAMAHALSHLMAILVPDHVLVYGPFVEDKRVFNTLLSDVRRLSPPFLAENTVIEVVSRESLSDAVAGTAGLFRKAYSSHLANLQQ